MKLTDRLLAFFGIQTEATLRQYELEEPLQADLERRAQGAGLPAEQLHTELVAAGLEELRTSEQLEYYWERLSDRQRQVVAFTCLGYTNRQIAARLHIGPETVKGYIRNVRVKWNLRSKADLRLLLSQWDFSPWEKEKENRLPKSPRSAPGRG